VYVFSVRALDADVSSMRVFSVRVLNVRVCVYDGRGAL